MSYTLTTTTTAVARPETATERGLVPSEVVRS
jgi:hypothetical protein